MSLLEQYEQQYAALVAEITAHIGRLQQQQASNNSNERLELCRKIDGSLPEAQELIEQMVLEVRELNPLQRGNFNSKLQVAQAELKRLQAEYKQTKEKQSQRNTFTTLDLGNSGDYYEDVSITNDQRQRLLDNSEQIERTGNRLTEGYRVALETEALGAQVLNDLHHQRETLQGARSRLRETNADISRAGRTLNSMMLRAMREKVVLYGMGVCFVLAVGVSLYLTFAPSSTPAVSTA